MSNLTKLEFMTLDISGKNYMSWILDTEIHFNAMNLGNTIKEGNQASLQDCTKSLILLRHHLHEDLKNEYLTVKDPLTLWNELKRRYDHQKTVILPKARYDWMLCGENVTKEDTLEKTFTTFHASNVLLQQQYRERGFKKYFELISCLLVAKQNNKLLMKNHQSRPTGTKPFLEVNAISSQTNGRGRSHGRGRGRGHGRNSRYHGTHGNNSTHKGKTSMHHKKWNYTKAKQNEKHTQNTPSKSHENTCHRCGMKGHWSCTCRTTKHLGDLYQASLKNIEKNIEMNFTDAKGVDLSYYDALYSSKSTRNLLSFKDIRRNGYHIETMNDGNKECLYITSIVYGKKHVVETLSAFSTGLYHTTIKPIESYVVVNQKFNDPKTFILWHDRLGHPGSSMMRRIIENSQGHELKTKTKDPLVP